MKCPVKRQREQVQSHRTDDLTVDAGLDQPILPSLDRLNLNPFQINISALGW